MRPTRRTVLGGAAAAALLSGALVACTGADAPPAATAVAAPTTITPTTITPAAGTSPSPAPAPAAPTSDVGAVAFRATVREIDATIASRLADSWRPGCPVPLGDLRLVTLRYWGMDGVVRDGEIVVHRDVADAVVRAFGRVFDARFPITRMRLVDDYGGDDGASMRDDNTSAFNCREVSGRPGVWSEHAYGRAIDINPLRNPWVRGAIVDPPEGAAYADRTRDVPGMLRADGPVVAAFREIGWGWGGDWTGGADWQHVSASGR